MAHRARWRRASPSSALDIVAKACQWSGQSCALRRSLLHEASFDNRNAIGQVSIILVSEHATASSSKEPYSSPKQSHKCSVDVSSKLSTRKERTERLPDYEGDQRREGDTPMVIRKGVA